MESLFPCVLRVRLFLVVVKNKRVMRFLLALVLFLLPFLSKGQLAWDYPTIDFGIIKEDSGIVTRVFNFKNLGDKNVGINRVITSCGCTRVGGYKRNIKPGSKDSLVVAYNPIGRPGAFNKLVKVITSDSVYSLHIVGNVIPSALTVKNRFPDRRGILALSSGIQSFEDIELYQRKSIRFFGCNLSDKTLPLSIEDLPRGASYSFYPDTVAAGNVFSASITLKVDTADFGMHRYYPVLVAGEERTVLEMTATIVAPPTYDVSCYAACRIDADRITFSDFGRYERAVADLVLENEGRADLVIKGIASNCEAVSAVNAFPMTIKPGEKARLELVLDVSKESKSVLNDILIIYTNDPKSPNRRVRLVGSK